MEVWLVRSKILKRNNLLIGKDRISINRWEKKLEIFLKNALHTNNNKINNKINQKEKFIVYSFSLAAALLLPRSVLIGLKSWAYPP